MSAVGLSACQRVAYLDSIHTGHTRTFNPNIPSFDFEAYTALNQITPGVRVLVRIPTTSLTYLAQADTRQAEYEVIFRVWDAGKRNVKAEFSVDGQANRADVHAPIFVDEWYAMRPGRYLIEAELTDVHARRTQRRYQRLKVQSAKPRTPYLSRIQLAGSQDGQVSKVYPSLYIPKDIDSLHVRVSLGGMTRLEEPDVQMQLVRFRADTSHASPPSWPRITEQTSFRFSETDTLQISTRTLAADHDVTIGVFFFPPLLAGAYKVQVRVEGTDVKTREVHRLQQDRFFASVGPSFPEVTRLHQMTAALAYIANEDEWEAIHEGAEAEQKKEFDAFWGRHIRQREKAADVIERYYARVEEANRQFTTHKEGWKTDRGMVYIVMGPPLYVDQNIDREIWHYSYNDPEDPSYFEFVRGYRYGLANPFEAYALKRHIQYQHVWQRAVRQWREGGR